MGHTFYQWLTKYFDLTWWTLFGFIAQGAFFMRFMVQWVASEKRKRSYMPKAFWYFSLFGAFLLIVYGVGRRDIVIVTGQCLALVIYMRNLKLYRDMDQYVELETEVEQLRARIRELEQLVAEGARMES